MSLADDTVINGTCPVHTHPFNGPFSGTAGWAGTLSKTNLDFTEARDSEWQWHQLGHMQVQFLKSSSFKAAKELYWIIGYH